MLELHFANMCFYFQYKIPSSEGNVLKYFKTGSFLPCRCCYSGVSKVIQCMNQYPNIYTLHTLTFSYCNQIPLLFCYIFLMISLPITFMLSFDFLCVNVHVVNEILTLIRWHLQIKPLDFWPLPRLLLVILVNLCILICTKLNN